MGVAGTVRVLTAESMRRLDRAAIESLGLPSLVLMENAAAGVADALGETWPQATSAAIFCGPGNNGGDGLALARLLAVRGYRVEPWLVLGEGRTADDLAGDAAVQRDLCRKLGLESRLLTEVGLERALARAAAHDVVVDALFGTGLSRSLEGAFADLVSALSELGRPRLAVDLPSGLSGSTGRPLGPHFQADLTVTFAALKVAHVLPPACDAVGRVVVADLGFPVELAAPEPGDLELLTAEELRAEAPELLAPRPAESHKGSYGHALVVAGSEGKAGAALLAVRAALRAGSGLVTAGVPASLAGILDGASPESMTLSLPETAGALAEAAAPVALDALVDKDALALGPGLGRGRATRSAIRALLEDLGEAGPPWVLDADGLQAYAGRLEEIARVSVPGILTPHPGEMGALLGLSSREVQENRVGAVRRAAQASGAVVVLKGHRTLVASPSGALSVNPVGNPGMATGGTGDVLTGILAALLAQGAETWTAARLGVYLHGLAGDRAARALDPGPGGQVGLVAGDLVAALPEAWSRLVEEGGSAR